MKSLVILIVLLSSFCFADIKYIAQYNTDDYRQMKSFMIDDATGEIPGSNNTDSYEDVLKRLRKIKGRVTFIKNSQAEVDAITNADIDAQAILEADDKADLSNWDKELKAFGLWVVGKLGVSNATARQEVKAIYNGL